MACCVAPIEKFELQFLVKFKLFGFKKSKTKCKVSESLLLSNLCYFQWEQSKPHPKTFYLFPVLLRLLS